MQVAGLIYVIVATGCVWSLSAVIFNQQPSTTFFCTMVRTLRTREPNHGQWTESGELHQSPAL